LIGANRADAEENQRKCAEELREKLLRQAIQRIPPGALGRTEFAGPRAILLNSQGESELTDRGQESTL
jgi:hypothetical protein